MKLAILLRIAVMIALVVMLFSVLHKQHNTTHNYCISTAFTPSQQDTIRQAVKVWDYGSRTPRFVESCSQYAIQVKIGTDAEKEYWSHQFDTSESYTAAVFDPEHNTALFFMDRIRSNRELLIYAGHEFGHSLSLPDLDDTQPAIMNAVARQEVLNDFHLYQPDIALLCRNQICQAQ